MKVLSKLWAGTAVVAFFFAGGAVFRFAVENKQLKEDLAYTHLSAHVENAYEKSFYEMSGHINSLEAGLSKVSAVSAAEVIHDELTQLQVNSHAALCDLASLPFQPGFGERIAAYINQVNDFSAYLQRSLFENGSLFAEDYEVITQLHKVSISLNESIAQLSKKIGAGTAFLRNGVLDIDTVNDLNNLFFDLNGNALRYPEMIYDGPFADIRAKSISIDRPVLTAERAAEAVEEQLESMGVKTVRLISEVTNRLPLYVFEVELNAGRPLIVEAAQNGGVIVFLSRSRGNLSESGQVMPSTEQAQETARKFARELDFDVEPVFVLQTPGVTYVSLAPVTDGVTVYCDLVKVAIDAEGICGFESFNYLANHKQRQPEQPQLSAAEAKKLLNKKINVTNYKLALIPVRNREVLCWEFECLRDDGLFYIFIDANAKKEVRILRQNELHGCFGIA